MTETENTTRGLSLSVLRNAELSDCTNEGVTSTANRLTLVGTLDSTKYRAGFTFPVPRTLRVTDPSSVAPAVALEIRKAAFRKSAEPDFEKIVNLVPVHWDAAAGRYVRTHSWAMAGGNYAYTSDARICELLEDVLGHRHGPISVHDHVES